MKYGIVISSAGKVSPSSKFDCVMAARGSFKLARATLRDGQAVTLFAETETGKRVSLEHVYQPRTMTFAEAFPA